ncbi:MAG: MBOAT family O-acyltransferase [Syntrophobacteraceae bacterium]|nr:MBOAT family protein [Desulfobacteraceae bacterium]
MVLNSPFFVFLFLPAALALYFVTPKQWKNLALFAASLFFYAWGDSLSLAVLLGSTAVNYGFGMLIERSSGNRTGRLGLFAGICANLGLLLYYKYLKFAVQNLDAVNLLDAGRFDFSGWHLPLGISFFTFGAVSYLMDVYRKKTAAEVNFLSFALYMALFPKILAGPIVRYADISGELHARGVDLESLGRGASRFVFGLGKKVLIANPAAMVADQIFSAKGDLGMPVAWLGILCYTVQIYFDFSGYSDMAIGLGRMFGFTFAENFNYPYISQSIREFWRRWHISLSSWFRDYLYIPLGGSHASSARTYGNLIMVFLLCGLWHGANWTFIVWGLYHGFFLTVERAFLGRTLQKAATPLRHVYTILVIMTGWVFFRADNLPHALRFLQAMFSFSWGEFEYYSMNFFSRELMLTLAMAVIGSMPVPGFLRTLRARIEPVLRPQFAKIFAANCTLGSLAFFILVLVASLMQLAASTYSPFIYARF